MKLADIAVWADVSMSFSVDGRPFPWPLAEEPTTSLTEHGLHKVHVEFHPAPVVPLGEAPIFCHGPFTSSVPTIQGAEFPWFITPDGFTYRAHDHLSSPVLSLAFLAVCVVGIRCVEPGVEPT